MLIVHELIMTKIDEETGDEIFYSYEGDCSWICDMIDEDDCKLLKEENK